MGIRTLLEIDNDQIAEIEADPEGFVQRIQKGLREDKPPELDSVTWHGSRLVCEPYEIRWANHSSRFGKFYSDVYGNGAIGDGDTNH